MGADYEIKRSYLRRFFKPLREKSSFPFYMLNPIHIQSFDYIHFVFWMSQEGLAYQIPFFELGCKR